jgi:CDP-diacylglycerol--serine O-phosphatidyltransferase
MRKGVYILPNLFTSGNLFCGFWAIISVFQEKYFYAAVAILLATLFDLLDGKVARLSGATSKFGVQYDSLADLISFGVAPALLAFSWALRPYGRFGWLAAFLFVVCGALRLARFNVMAASGDTKYFKGLPIPAAAMTIALTILLYLRLIETGWVKDIVILVMIYVLAFLMVSNIRYFSFKEFDLAKKKPFSLFIFVVLSMIVIVMEPVIVLFAFILFYVFSGPVKMVMVWHKRRAMKGLEPVEDEATVRG